MFSNFLQYFLSPGDQEGSPGFEDACLVNSCYLLYNSMNYHHGRLYSLKISGEWRDAPILEDCLRTV